MSRFRIIMNDRPVECVHLARTARASAASSRNFISALESCGGVRAEYRTRRAIPCTTAQYILSKAKSYADRLARLPPPPSHLASLLRRACVVCLLAVEATTIKMGDRSRREKDSARLASPRSGIRFEASENRGVREFETRERG